MNKTKKPKITMKLSHAQIEAIPGQIGYIICHGNKIVHSTIPKDENPVQIAFNAINLASRANSPEFEHHKPHAITIQFEKFMFELFQAGAFFIIVKKRVEDSDN